MGERGKTLWDGQTERVTKYSIQKLFVFLLGSSWVQYPGSAQINSSTNTQTDLFLTVILLLMDASMQGYVLNRCPDKICPPRTQTDPQHHSLEPGNGPSLLGIILFCKSEL